MSELDADGLAEGGRRLIQAERQAAAEARAEARKLRHKVQALQKDADQGKYWRRRARDAEADAARLRAMLAARATTPTPRTETP